MGRVISRANEATDSRRNAASAYFAQRDRSFRAIVTDGGLLHAFFYVTSIGHDSREIAVTIRRNVVHDGREIAVTMPRNGGHDTAKSPVTMT